MSYLKSELSQSNPYWLPKHRYYELKHYCLQYPYWKRAYRELGELHAWQYVHTGGYILADPTHTIAEQREWYGQQIEIVERAAMVCSSVMADYILMGVTQEMTYTQLRMMHQIPCGRDMYYQLYRQFFWTLSEFQMHSQDLQCL